MTDRYAEMERKFDGPCPTCGQRGDGIPTYRPKHAQAIDQSIYEAFAAKPEGAPK